MFLGFNGHLLHVCYGKINVLGALVTERQSQRPSSASRGSGLSCVSWDMAQALQQRTSRCADDGAAAGPGQRVCVVSGKKRVSRGGCVGLSRVGVGWPRDLVGSSRGRHPARTCRGREELAFTE